MSIGRAFGMISPLIVVLVIACAPSAPTTAPPASPTRGAVRYATVEASAQPAGSVRVELTNYAFQPAEIPVPAGKVVLYLVNSSTVPHALTLRNPAVSALAVVAASLTIEAGHAAVLTIDDLPAATYRVTCPIGGHADNGMVGTLTAR